MARFKHLSLSDRIAIQSMLSSRLSLAAIARHLGRDHRTITREVLNYRTFLFLGALGRASNNCAKPSMINPTVIPEVMDPMI